MRPGKATLGGGATVRYTATGARLRRRAAHLARQTAAAEGTRRPTAARRRRRLGLRVARRRRRAFVGHERGLGVVLLLGRRLLGTAAAHRDQREKKADDPRPIGRFEIPSRRSHGLPVKHASGQRSTPRSERFFRRAGDSPSRRSRRLHNAVHNAFARRTRHPLRGLGSPNSIMRLISVRREMPRRSAARV